MGGEGVFAALATMRTEAFSLKNERTLAFHKKIFEYFLTKSFALFFYDDSWQIFHRSRFSLCLGQRQKEHFPPQRVRVRERKPKEFPLLLAPKREVTSRFDWGLTGATANGRDGFLKEKRKGLNWE